jgi:large subunit ribosomal protein L18
MRKYIGKIKDQSLQKRNRRKLVIRKKVEGSLDRPRVNVNKTNRHLVVQVVNDLDHKTLFSVQTFGKEAVKGTSNREGAKLVGAKVAEILISKNIKSVVFDRNGYKYTGVIAALADAIREKGVQV